MCAAAVVVVGVIGVPVTCVEPKRRRRNIITKKVNKIQEEETKQYEKFL